MADQASSTPTPHPLQQIADTPTHKLLLKQWLKEETLILTRVSLKETQIDSVRREITSLYTLFFVFHSLSILLLFNTPSPSTSSCSRSWVPSICSVLFSAGAMWAVRYKAETEAHLEKVMAREKEDGKLLRRCVDELRRKGADFDLLKEVDALRRAKSLRAAGAEGKPVRKWSGRDFVLLFFFTVACFVVGLIRVVLCD